MNTDLTCGKTRRQNDELKVSRIEGRKNKLVHGWMDYRYTDGQAERYKERQIGRYIHT
jgi:hypothetical protein